MPNVNEQEGTALHMQMSLSKVLGVWNCRGGELRGGKSDGDEVIAIVRDSLKWRVDFRHNQ